MAAPALPRPEIALNLALAVVAQSAAPLLLLDGDFAVIAASTSFFRAFRIDPAAGPGRKIFQLGGGEWDVPQLRSLLDATLAGHAEIDSYEMSLEYKDREPRCLLLNARRLDYENVGEARLLLTLSDVTDARGAERLKDALVQEKDALLREKTILLQEVQHRVANSLQIIASVLIQSARNVQSEETRLHLHDAHQRVMSVAVLQQQLASSRVGDVSLRAYFTELCKSLGASMIRDHDKISLEVSADDCTVKADISVSLGLIVTELVINALKHAFPSGRAGKIEVRFRSKGPGWTLAVADDGVGIFTAPASARPGLGTSIVEALANQLGAVIKVADTGPGTSVTLIHTGVAGADGRVKPELTGQLL